jgi:hypothetical protein
MARKRINNTPKKDEAKSIKSDTETPATAEVTELPPAPWSDWIWSDNPPCYFRARKNAKGRSTFLILY